MELPPGWKAIPQKRRKFKGIGLIGVAICFYAAAFLHMEPFAKGLYFLTGTVNTLVGLLWLKRSKND